MYSPLAHTKIVWKWHFINEPETKSFEANLVLILLLWHFNISTSATSLPWKIFCFDDFIYTISLACPEVRSLISIKLKLCDWILVFGTLTEVSSKLLNLAEDSRRDDCLSPSPICNSSREQVIMHVTAFPTKKDSSEAYGWRLQHGVSRGRSRRSFITALLMSDNRFQSYVTVLYMLDPSA